MRGTPALIAALCLCTASFAPVPIPPTGYPEEDALLRSIRDKPNDDTVRLAYADWLDEHDRPLRAEFIRVQVELARTSPQTHRHTVLSTRERELMKNPAATGVSPWIAERYPGRVLENANRKAFQEARKESPHDLSLIEHHRNWLLSHGTGSTDEAEASELTRHLHRQGFRLSFHRGFLEGIECDDAIFDGLLEGDAKSPGARLLHEAPFTRHLYLHARGGNVRGSYWLWTPGILDRLESLRLEGGLGAPLYLSTTEIAYLGKHLSGLKYLNIQFDDTNSRTQEVLEALLQTDMAHRLHSLGVWPAERSSFLSAHQPRIQELLTKFLQSKPAIVELGRPLFELVPTGLQRNLTSFHDVREDCKMMLNHLAALE